jgi:hypothetical protein
MTEFKFYHEWHGDQYLELHANHTVWKINKEFSWDDYNAEVDICILNMQYHFKDLTVYQLGRSGRHICVEDTPINRRRYKHLVAYAEKLEQELVNYFNNFYVMNEEE